jgi:hypothetical protein
MADLYCGGLATPTLITVNAVDDCTGEHLRDGPYAYVFDGVRSVEWEPVVNEAQEAQFVDNAGKTVCTAETCDDLLGYDLSFEKCNLPLELVALLTGQPVVTNVGGDAIGWYHDDSVGCAPPVAVRIWSKTLGCTASAKWGVLVFPFAKFTFPTPGVEGDLIQFSTVTAKARKIPGTYDAYGDGVFGDDGALGWTGSNKRGSFGFYYTDDDPQIADCALVTIPPA